MCDQNSQKEKEEKLKEVIADFLSKFEGNYQHTKQILLLKLKIGCFQDKTKVQTQIYKDYTRAKLFKISNNTNINNSSQDQEQDKPHEIFFFNAVGLSKSLSKGLVKRNEDE